MSNAIYKELERGNYNVALRLAHRMVSKKPHDNLPKALLALSLNYAGEAYSCDLLINEIMKSVNFDEPTLCAMLPALSRLHRYDDAMKVVDNFYQSHKNQLSGNTFINFAFRFRDVPKIMAYALDESKRTRGSPFAADAIVAYAMGAYYAWMDSGRITESTKELKLAKFMMSRVQYITAEADDKTEQLIRSNSNLFWAKTMNSRALCNFSEIRSEIDTWGTNHIFGESLTNDLIVLSFFEEGKLHEAAMKAVEFASNDKANRTELIRAIFAVEAALEAGEKFDGFEDGLIVPAVHTERNKVIAKLESLRLRFYADVRKADVDIDFDTSTTSLWSYARDGLLDQMEESIHKFISNFSNEPHASFDIFPFISLLPQTCLPSIHKIAASQISESGQHEATFYANLLTFSSHSPSLDDYDVLLSVYQKLLGSRTLLPAAKFDVGPSGPVWTPSDQIIIYAADVLLHLVAESSWAACNSALLPRIIVLLDILMSETLQTGHHYLAFRVIQILLALEANESAGKYLNGIQVKNSQIECISKPTISAGLGLLGGSATTVHNLPIKVECFTQSSGVSLHTSIEDAINNRCTWMIDQFRERLESISKSSTLLHAQVLHAVSPIAGLAAQTRNGADAIFGNSAKFVKSSGFLDLSHRLQAVWDCERLGNNVPIVELSEDYIQNYAASVSIFNTSARPDVVKMMDCHAGAQIPLISLLESRVPFPLHFNQRNSRLKCIIPKARDAAWCARNGIPGKEFSLNMNEVLWKRHASLISLVSAVASHASSTDMAATETDITTLTKKFKAMSQHFSKDADTLALWLVDAYLSFFFATIFPTFPQFSQIPLIHTEHILSIDIPLLCSLMACIQNILTVKAKKMKADERSFIKAQQNLASNLLKTWMAIAVQVAETRTANLRGLEISERTSVEKEILINFDESPALRLLKSEVGEALQGVQRSVKNWMMLLDSF